MKLTRFQYSICFKKYDAPADINYISIDTEGSEFEILKDFNFTKYRFNLITIEHNYSSTREPLRQLFKKMAIAEFSIIYRSGTIGTYQ